MSYFALLDMDSEQHDTPAVKATGAAKKETAGKKETAAPAKATGTQPLVTAPKQTGAKDNKTVAAPAAAAANSAPKKAKDAGDKKPASAAGAKKEGAAPAATEETRQRKEDFGRKKDDRKHGAPQHGKEEKDANGDPKQPRKREFDRRSSTGRSGEQRKDGSGPHGFGNVKQEAAEAEKDPSTAEPAVEGAEGEAAAAATTEEAAAPVEEGPKVFTYDEYLKKKNEELANVANKELFAAPKQLRVVEASEFEGLKAKQSEEDTVFMKAKTVAAAAKKSAAKANKAPAVALELGFKVAPAEQPSSDYERRPPREFKDRNNNNSSRPPREQNGAPRSSEGARNNNNNNNNNGAQSRGPRPAGNNSRSSIDVHDASSFPSL